MTALTAPCTECNIALQPDRETGRFYCVTAWCAALGVEIPVWRVLKRSGLAAPDPAGLPRPVYRGLPVPWVAARTADKVWWRALDAERLAGAQTFWLCQFCGLALPEEAWIMATPEGQILQAALHEACLDTSLAFCTHLSSEARTATARLVTREQVLVNGHPLTHAEPSDPDFLPVWKLKEPDRTGHECSLATCRYTCDTDPRRVVRLVSDQP